MRALVIARLNASTVLTSGFAAPLRTAMPSGARARSVSVPAAMRFAAIRSLKPRRERMTTSAATPVASWAVIVCGPLPCEAPDPVETLMPLVRSNSGNSCSYGLLKPPEMITFNCPDATSGIISNAPARTTIACAARARLSGRREGVFQATVIGGLHEIILETGGAGCLPVAFVSPSGDRDEHRVARVRNRADTAGRAAGRPARACHRAA